MKFTVQYFGHVSRIQIITITISLFSTFVYLFPSLDNVFWFILGSCYAKQ